MILFILMKQKKLQRNFRWKETNLFATKAAPSSSEMNNLRHLKQENGYIKIDKSLSPGNSDYDDKHYAWKLCDFCFANPHSKINGLMVKCLIYAIITKQKQNGLL